MCPKLFDETLVGHWLIPLGLIDMFPSIVSSCCILKNSCLIISFILKNGTSKDCLTNQNTIAEVKEFMYETSHKRVWGKGKDCGTWYIISIKQTRTFLCIVFTRLFLRTMSTFIHFWTVWHSSGYTLLPSFSRVLEHHWWFCFAMHLLCTCWPQYASPG